MKNIKYKLSGLQMAVLLITLSCLSACKSNQFSSAPKVSAFRGGKLPPPPGMVYVPSGTILYKGSLDSGNVGKDVSLSAFFIDETEVTNKQYREFVNWVADSIAVTDYLQDDQYFLANSDDGQGNRRINWSRVKKLSPLWKSKVPAIQERLAPMVMMRGSERVLNPQVIRYRFTYLKTKGNAEKICDRYRWRDACRRHLVTGFSKCAIGIDGCQLLHT